MWRYVLGTEVFGAHSDPLPFHFPVKAYTLRTDAGQLGRPKLLSGAVSDLQVQSCHDLRRPLQAFCSAHGEYS